MFPRLDFLPERCSLMKINPNSPGVLRDEPFVTLDLKRISELFASRCQELVPHFSDNSVSESFYEGVTDYLNDFFQILEKMTKTPGERKNELLSAQEKADKLLSSFGNPIAVEVNKDFAEFFNSESILKLKREWLAEKEREIQAREIPADL